MTASSRRGLDPVTEGHVLTTLIERARGAMTRAYAPYSRFRVGAALLATDGSITEGCNVENAAYPATFCAERSALAAAVVRGVRDFTAIVIATESDVPTPPCGVCRQALMEFAPQMTVVSVCADDDAQGRWTLFDLLPDAFTPSSLGHS